MKAVFFTREEAGRVAADDMRETDLALALQAGAKLHGDTIEIRQAKGAYPPDVEIVDCDLVCMMGVKSRHWFTAYAEAGIPWVYFDKGYIRERADVKWLKYMRLSACSHHPIDYLAAAKHNQKRADAMGFGFKPWKKDRGRYVVLDGGSEKNFKFNGILPESATLLDVDAHCARLIELIGTVTDRPVRYRPKPSSKGRQGIEGAEFSRDLADYDKKSPDAELLGAWAVVTYNGAICVDAHRLGIPSIVLGSAPGRPISSKTIGAINIPFLAPDDWRRQWLNNLAWCQFTPGEYANGTAWPIIRKMVEMTPIKTPAEACPCLPL